MGLAEMLLGKDNPFAQWTMNNQGYLGALGAGIGSGQNIQSGLSSALQMMPQAKQYDVEQRRQAEADAKVLAQTESTKTWLTANHPDLAQMVDAGMDVGEAWNVAIKRMSPQGGSEFDERFEAGQQYGLSGDDLNTFALTGSVPGTSRANVTHGLTPIWGTFEDGTAGYGVQASDGTFKRVDMPEGFTPSNPYDLNAQKAAGGAFGKATGGAQFSIPQAQTELDQSLDAIGGLQSEEIKAGMEDWFKQWGALPRGMWVQGGSNMAKFQTAANHIIDRSWLSARAMLKGAGQITDYEGAKAENAVSMMKGALEKGDKASYEAAVKEYEYWIQKGFEKVAQQANAMPGFGGVPGQTSPSSSGDGWSVIGVE